MTQIPQPNEIDLSSVPTSDLFAQLDFLAEHISEKEKLIYERIG